MRFTKLYAFVKIMQSKLILGGQDELPPDYMAIFSLLFGLIGLLIKVCEPFSCIRLTS